MSRTKLGVTWLAVGALALATGAAGAQAPSASDEEIAAAKVAAADADLADAIAELKLMSDFLAAQKSFSLEAQTGYDSVQDNGQELEFGGSRKITVRRPDRVRVEDEHRDGGKSVLFFDGQTISIDLPNQSNYASVQKPGTLDAAIDYIVDDLGTPQPLADLMHSSVLAEVVDRLESGFVVGDETIAGTPSVHVAFRTEATDVQLWIASGEQPLLQRIAITYKTSPGSPKFWAQVTDWDLNAKTPDKLFAYTPPDGANQIPIGARAQEASQ